MVLIQLLLPTTGVAGADGVAPLAQTRRELAERFNGLTAYLRSPRRVRGPLPMATLNRTTSSWWKS